MFDVDIQEKGAQRVAALRHEGPFTELGPSFQAIAGWAMEKQLFGPGTALLGVFYDDPKTTLPTMLRSDACITVADSVEGDPGRGIEIREVPGGTYAVGVMTGPYSRLPEAYDWLHGEWLPGSGYRSAVGPCFEAYLNDPSQVPEDQVMTAIHIPVSPKDS